jgi:urease accessory protein UreE
MMASRGRGAQSRERFATDHDTLLHFALKRNRKMNYGDVLFGIWIGFTLAVAWYDIVWFNNR